MKKQAKNLYGSSVFVLLLIVSLAGCATTKEKSLWESNGAARTKTIVISDIHLGIDDAFAEDVANKPYLEQFLKRVAVTPDVKELVIAGDFLDEWYLPMEYPAYPDSNSFYKKVADNNKNIIEALKNVMKGGVNVVYVPGNHDMLLDARILEGLIPGIRQARDTDGLGVYLTGGGRIAIEHGHRYDVFSAPDSVSNQSITSGKTSLPPGYFYARYAASWVTEGKPAVKKKYPVIATAPPKSDIDQFSAYLYYSVLTSEFNRMTPKAGFEEKSIALDIDGYHGAYSIADMFPILQQDGTISAPLLYRNFQRTWDERQKRNLVKIPTSFIPSVAGALGFEFLAQQAKTQYLENPATAQVEVVIFGHTHIPQYLPLGNGKTYVNSGTWIDHNTSDKAMTTRTFVVVDAGVKTSATLYQYGEDGFVKDISRSMIR